MDTIWTFIIIISASLQPSDMDSNILGGDVENRTTIYFTTQEACNDARDQALANKEEIKASVGNMSANVVVTVCEGVQIAN